MRQINCLVQSCLILDEKFNEKKIEAIPADQAFLFTSIAELVYDENIAEKL